MYFDFELLWYPCQPCSVAETEPVEPKLFWGYGAGAENKKFRLRNTATNPTNLTSPLYVSLAFHTPIRRSLLSLTPTYISLIFFHWPLCLHISFHWPCVSISPFIELYIPLPSSFIEPYISLLSFHWALCLHMYLLSLNPVSLSLLSLTPISLFCPFIGPYKSLLFFHWAQYPSPLLSLSPVSLTFPFTHPYVSHLYFIGPLCLPLF